MYIPPSFEYENAKHTNAIAALTAYYQHTAKVTELPGRNDLGYDLQIVFKNHPGDCWNVEVKSRAVGIQPAVHLATSLEALAPAVARALAVADDVNGRV